MAAIQALFIEQCAHGAQSKELTHYDAVACGQYLKYTSSRQRGLHGSAAAISVLARGTTEETRRLSTKLLEYLNKRDEIEQHVVGSRPDRMVHLKADRVNVIKLSEVLYGLRYVSSAIGDRDPLVRRIAGDLRGGSYEDKGWSYFLGDKQEVQILPTAFAIRALAAHGYPIDAQVSSLIHVLDRPTSAQADIFVRTAGIFALTFIEPRPRELTSDKLRRLLTASWRSLETLLEQDLEANIEYSFDDRNYYVRVPWQLYLIASSAHLRPYRIFSSSRLRRRFQSVLHAAKGTGFVYPHSGERISARTNAILFDALDLIHADVTKNTWLQGAGIVSDRVRLALGSKAVSAFGVLFALAVAGYSIARWVAERRSIADLAPELLAAVLIFLLALRNRE
jgi:hypothetical protein